MTAEARRFQRRKPTEADRALADERVRRFRDAKFGKYVVKILPGEQYVTGDPEEMLVTVLGSCIAACIRDPAAAVGGMNHFMLPGRPVDCRPMDCRPMDCRPMDCRPMDCSPGYDWGKASLDLRYGSFAMEQLINGLLSRGARRDRLEVKLFGGARILDGSGMVGRRNIEFVEGYLRDEGFAVVARNVGGAHPQRVHYMPQTGEAFVLELRRREDAPLLTSEHRYASALPSSLAPGTIELFDEPAESGR